MASERGELVGHGQVVSSLSDAIARGEIGRLVPGLLKRVCNEGAWRKRIVAATKEVVEFGDFASFVGSARPDGLGIDLDTLRKLCRDDPEARDIIDRETQRPSGGDRHSQTFNDNNVNTEQRPVGNSADQALRKLRADAPSLHGRVLAGELSPHAAMVEAGFRRKSITVPLDPERAAATLARHFDPDELTDLIVELQSILASRRVMA